MVIRSLLTAFWTFLPCPDLPRVLPSLYASVQLTSWKVCMVTMISLVTAEQSSFSLATKRSKMGKSREWGCRIGWLEGTSRERAGLLAYLPFSGSRKNGRGTFHARCEGGEPAGYCCHPRFPNLGRGQKQRPSSTRPSTSL